MALDFGGLIQSFGTTAFQDVAVPYLQQTAGVQSVSDADLQYSRNQMSQLNGSGPNDPAGAMRASDGLMGMLLGRKLDGSGTVSYGIPWGLLAIGGLVVGAFLMFRKR